MIENPNAGTGRSWRLVLPAALAAATFLVSGHLRSVPSSTDSPARWSPAPRFDAELVHVPQATRDLVAPLPVERVLAPGQSLDGLLAGLGLGPNARHGLIAAIAEEIDVRRLRPGLRALVYRTASGPAGVELTVHDRGRLRLDPAAGLWAAEWVPFVENRSLQSVAGDIRGSLAEAVAAAGAPGAVAFRLADVLQWDVDFSRDLRRGDRFEVVYEEVRREGTAPRVGEIAAVRFWNRDRLIEAYRYVDGGYYDADGRPLKKMFLRSPMTFTRVTSKFSHRRFHPVLKRYRPHYGVDYGGPVGAPVKVTATGVVTFAGWDRGGGKTIKVRHPNEYLSAYLHLNDFAKGLRVGQRVQQGDVIGYLGATGLVTGPHLDYRVQHRGRWIDPLTLRSVPAEPVPQGELASFRAWRDELRRALVEGPPEGSLDDLLPRMARLETPAGPLGGAVAGGR